jgi:hypothetical protein
MLHIIYHEWLKCNGFISRAAIFTLQCSVTDHSLKCFSCRNLARCHEGVIPGTSLDRGVELAKVAENGVKPSLRILHYVFGKQRLAVW